MSLMKKIILIVCSLTMVNIYSGTRDQARKIYNSITGSSATRTELDRLEAALIAGNVKQATREITYNKEFYNVTVKDFSTPWSNEAGTVLFPLNDMSATVIGFVRDNRPFNEVLWRNVMYQASDSIYYTDSRGNRFNNLLTLEFYRYMIVERRHPRFIADYKRNVGTIGTSINSCNDNEPICKMAVTNDHLYLEFADTFVPTFIRHNNSQYEELEEQGINLGDSRTLVAKTQNPSLHTINIDPLQEQVTSGLLTTRAYGAAYLSAGTNRAAVAFAMKHFLCKEMEQLNDVSRPDFRVRRDIDRAPGGVTDTFKNSCTGCHSGMDALTGAFAYYDYTNGVLQYNQGQVVTKMNHNALYSDGFITQSDSWINLWTEGQNASLGWGTPQTGNGVKSFGKMLSETEQFSHCMAEQVFKAVCFNKPDNTKERTTVLNLAEQFKNNNYNMRELFVDTAIACMGN